MDSIFILNTVADLTNTKVEDMRNGRRFRDIVKARHISMFCHRAYTDMSLDAIGKVFNKDHATVVHAMKSVTDQAKVYKTYRIELERIMDVLQKKIDTEYEKYKDYETERV